MPSPSMPRDVREAFAAVPADAREPMLAVRDAIFATAGADARIGPLAEVLRWGEPSYRPRSSGTTVRLGWSPKRPDQWGVYVSCQTTLIEGLRATAGGALRYDGNRGVLFALGDAPPLGRLRPFLAEALTYKLR
ncbi:MAG: DUF1801 domain-containing protein [Myxococcota bacterium]